MTTGWNAALNEIGTIPPKPCFRSCVLPPPEPALHSRKQRPTLPYKSKTRCVEVTPTHLPPIVSIALVAS